MFLVLFYAALLIHFCTTHAQPQKFLSQALNLCPLPLIKNGHVIEVRSVPSLGPWQHNTTLSFACNRPYSNQLQQSVCFHGKWEPEPECREMFCPAPESAFHRNAMLKTDINSSMSVSFLARLDYSAPPQVYPVEPFRLCDFNEQSALQWIDYNFGFSGVVCFSFHMLNGKFKKSFYYQGEFGTFICANGCRVQGQTMCIDGKFRGEVHCSCEPCDPPIVTPTINCDNCLHGFKTQWQDGSQHCECEPGYVMVGENTCIDQCVVNNPCQNGRCFRNASQFCQCEQGWTGDFCEKPLSRCTPSTCSGNGKCVESHPGETVCICNDSFRGRNCEVAVNYCDFEPCLYNGTCTSESGGYRCSCRPGFTGKVCETRLMEHCYCLNGGRVNNTWPECSCQCLSLYTGKNCERMITCADMAQDCQHNATCVDVETGPFCNCTGTEFTGKFCETELFHSFNIFFNGEPQNQMIVSRNFSSYLTRNMTVCLFLMDIAADPTSSFAPFMALQDQIQTILFSSQRVDYVTNEQKIELKDWNISTRDWHSLCIKTPPSLTEKWQVYLDGDERPDMAFLGTNFTANLFKVLDNAILDFQFRDQTATLELAPASDARIFHGYISLAQIFDYSLPESRIASSSSLCGLNGTDLNPFISWDKSFTKVSPANPGAKQEQPGICNNLQLLLTIGQGQS